MVYQATDRPSQKRPFVTLTLNQVNSKLKRSCPQIHVKYVSSVINSTQDNERKTFLHVVQKGPLRPLPLT